MSLDRSRVIVNKSIYHRSSDESIEVSGHFAVVFVLNILIWLLLKCILCIACYCKDHIIHKHICYCK